MPAHRPLFLLAANIRIPAFPDAPHLSGQSRVTAIADMCVGMAADIRQDLPATVTFLAICLAEDHGHAGNIRQAERIVG